MGLGHAKGGEVPQAVEKSHAGPAKVSGTAGTGKTVVALHRAAHLARQGSGSVLLTTCRRYTFSTPPLSSTRASALRSRITFTLKSLRSHRLTVNALATASSSAP